MPWPCGRAASSTNLPPSLVFPASFFSTQPGRSLVPLCAQARYRDQQRRGGRPPGSRFVVATCASLDKLLARVELSMTNRPLCARREASCPEAVTAHGNKRKV